MTENKLFRKMINWRRDFHRHPEVGWMEYLTTIKIALELEQMGFKIHTGKSVCSPKHRMGVPPLDTLKNKENELLKAGVSTKWLKELSGGQTGVVAIKTFERPGPTIALRFDIDALKIEETHKKSHYPVQEHFTSVENGLMHACGHDGHVAIGLGVATYISEHFESLGGEIRLIFQPAEEGCRGAKSIVENGWLDEVDYFLSGHIAFQSFILGEVVSCVTNFMATTKIDITYKGKSSHAGSHPEEGKNALLAAAAASIHLNGISRNGSGDSRINIGSIRSESSRNIIPDLATLEIETRGSSTEVNNYMTNEVIRIIESVGKLYDVEVDWEIVGAAPETSRDKRFAEFISQCLIKKGTFKNVVTYKELNASEDVVYMMNHVKEKNGKASYLLFGSPLVAGHHSNNFDFNEEVLFYAYEALTSIIDELQHVEGE